MINLSLSVHTLLIWIFGAMVGMPVATVVGSAARKYSKKVSPEYLYGFEIPLVLAVLAFIYILIL